MGKIYIASDHAGFELKEKLKVWLSEEGFEIKDFGSFEKDQNDDFTDFVIPLAKEIAKDQSLKGIIIGGSGQGEAIVANRFKGVRAVVYQGQPRTKDGHDLHSISVTREHNDSNILSLGARFISFEEAKETIDTWLKEPFAAKEKYIRRIEATDVYGSSV